MRKAFFVTIIVSLISFVGMAYIVSTTKNECTEYQNIKIFIKPGPKTTWPTTIYSFYTDNFLMMITDIMRSEYAEVILGASVMRNDSLLFHPEFCIRAVCVNTDNRDVVRFRIEEFTPELKHFYPEMCQFDFIFCFSEDSILDINAGERARRSREEDHSIPPQSRQMIIDDYARWAASISKHAISRYRGPLPGDEYGWIQKREGETRDVGRGEVKQDFLFQKCSGVKTFISNSPFMNRQGRSIYSVYPDVPFMTITRMPDSGETYVLMGSYKLQGDTLDFTPELYVDQCGTTPDSLPQYRVARVQDMSISENPEMQRHVFLFNEDYLMDINRYGRYIYRLRGPLSGSVNDWTIKEIWRTPKRRQ